MTLPPCSPHLVVVAPRSLDRELLARALDRADGVDVVAAVPTLAGDLTVAEASVDAVLVRITSPGADLLTEVALATRHRDRPRVVVVTGYVDAYVADRLHAAGAAAVATPDEPLAGVIALVLGTVAGGALRPVDRRPLSTRHRLTNRELEVLDHLADGMPPGQIAHLLDVRVATVRDHIKSLRAKLDCSSATQLVVTAHRLGLAPHVSRPLL